MLSILIADDNQHVLMAEADIVADAPGVEIVSLCEDVEGAARAGELHKPRLAFVDAWLKGGGGAEAARRIRSVSPDTTIVALVSTRHLEEILKLHAAGVSACYEKERLTAELPAILEAARSR
jgi:DNA-binding NarL/FixJ family response regulator